MFNARDMLHGLLRLVPLGVFVVILAIASKINYKVCTTKSNECAKFRDGIQCDYNPSVKACLQKIDKEPDTFGSISGAEVCAAAKSTRNVVVVGEFIHEERIDEKFEHEFVAIASNGIKNVEDLRGTTLCHPGLRVDNIDTDLLAKFDLKLSDIINKNCHLDLEDRLQFSSGFFGHSCIPGEWTSNSTLDEQLKKKYHNLVKLCSNDPNENAFDQSLNCLLNTAKGVALTTLHTVEKYKAKNPLSAYKYICPNGTINDDKNSCRWFAQPLNIIVANKNLAESLPTDLEKWFEEDSPRKRSVDLDPVSTENLKNVTFPSVRYKINVIKDAPSIKEYISGAASCGNDIEGSLLTCSKKRHDDTNKKDKVRVCTTAKHTDACQQIDRTDNIKCEISVNKAGCLLMIENGESSFGTFTAEEAFLATQLTDNLTVVGEFIPESSNERAELEIVVVVKDTIDVVNGALKGLKGCKYCHPGFETTELNSYILKEFEMQVLKENGVDNCDGDVETIAENYIKMLDGYFGPSCRPGKWVQDLEFDRTLKAKYPKLTQLCNITAYTTNTDNPFLQSFNCVLGGQGDVALTTRAVVNEMLNSDLDLDGYRYICRDGYTAKMDKTCAWTRQPWQLLLAHQDVVSNLKNDLRDWFSNSIFNPNIYSAGADDASKKLDERYQEHLMTIMFPYIKGYKLNITDSNTLSDYMEEFRQSQTLDESKLCKTELKLCTVSIDEQRKCEWFARASLNYGIQPVIKCVQKADKLQCIDAIHSRGADIVTIDADLGFPAFRKNLSAVAFPVTKKDMEVYSLIVVTGNIKRMENLKNKRGCFNQYGSMAWVSFIDFVLPKDSCDYDKLISDFVTSACMPGARDPKFGKSSHIDGEKLCNCGSNVSSSTAVNFDADTFTGNLYYGNEGALACLADHGGDFAVLTKTDKTITNFTVLCKNGTLANYPGLNVDQDCYLSITTTSSIVARRGDSMNRDIELALREIDARFAVDIHSPLNFYRAKDLLFEDSTIGLELPNSNSKNIKNYVRIFKNIDDCEPTGKGDGANVASVSVMYLSICTLLTKLIM